MLSKKYLVKKTWVRFLVDKKTVKIPSRREKCRQKILVGN